MKRLNMSVAIPYHGRAEFFKETLDSLVVQTSNNFEVIVSDDSNNEKDIADLKLLSDEYAKKGLNIKVIRTKANLGPIMNTKQAIDAAKNDIVRILHTDDYIAPKTIEFELQIFEQNPETFFAFHNASVFRKKFIPNEHNKYSIDSWKDNWLKEKNFTHSILPSCLIIRKDVLNSVGFFNADFQFMYDWEYQIRLFEYAAINNKTVAEIPAGYVGWRISEQSESYTKSLLCWQDSRRIAELLEYSYERMIKNFKHNFDKRLLWEYTHNGRSFRLPVRFKIREILKKICKIIFSKKKSETKCVYRILGVRFSTTRSRIKKAKKFIKWISTKSPVPLNDKKNFYFYSSYPMWATDVSRSYNKCTTPKIGVILQGPIINQNNFTYETILMYKKMMDGQNIEIILSTWTDTPKDEIDRFNGLGITVVLSDKIEYTGRGNINLQIISSSAGIDKAKELNCEYVWKTRTDQRFYKQDLFDFFLNLIKQFPLRKKNNLSSRLVACSFNTFKYRLYGVSDMMLFGKTEDVEKYWKIPFDNCPLSDWKNKTAIQLFEKWCPETYATREFLKNIRHEIKDTIQDSLGVYAEYFVFVDKEQIQMFWPKYSNKSLRWNFFFPNAMEECNFTDWLNLYSHPDSCKNYSEKHWYELPAY